MFHKKKNSEYSTILILRKEPGVHTVTMLWAGPSGARCQVQETDLFLLQNIQTGSGTHIALYFIGTRGSLPGCNQPVHAADHVPLYSAQWSCIFALCLHSVMICAVTTLPLLVTLHSHVCFRATHCNISWSPIFHDAYESL